MCPFGCDVCHRLPPLSAIVYFKPLDSFLGKKLNPKTPPASLFTPRPLPRLGFFSLSTKTLPSPRKQTLNSQILCGRLQGTDAHTHTHTHTHTCHHYSKKNGRKKRERRHTSDLTALPVTSHDITAIHLKRKTVHVYLTHFMDYICCSDTGKHSECQDNGS